MHAYDPEPLLDHQIRNGWAAIDIPSLAHVFIDSCKRVVNKTPFTVPPLCLFANVQLPKHIREDDTMTIRYAFLEIATRCDAQPALYEDPFIKPIAEATTAANIQSVNHVSVIAPAMANISLPAHDIPRSPVLFLAKIKPRA